MVDGYCQQLGPEKLREIERGWEESDRPPIPAPPMANVALAVELATGLDAVRDLDFHGTTLRLLPTPYHTALRLLAWMQQLERLEAIGELLGEHLQELRDCYVELANLAGTLVLDHEGPNPFLEATPADFHRVIAFALDSGSDLRRPTARSGSEIPQRYDSVFYLLAFRETFGKMPETWKEFAAGCSYIRRATAERSLEMFAAFAAAQSGGDGAEKWLASQTQAAGHDP